MKDEYRIITFGLTEEENELVAANVPTKNYEVFDTDAPTDVIAIGSEAMIIYAPAMDQDSIDSIFELYTEIDGCTHETIIWLGEPKPPKNLQKIFKCYESFGAIRDNIKYLLLNAHTKSKKAYDYSTRLVMGYKIIALVRERPGITTEKLSEILELPVRSVQRYLAALQAAGEWIEYDRTLHGWKLFHGKSALIGEVFPGEWE